MLCSAICSYKNANRDKPTEREKSSRGSIDFRVNSSSGEPREPRERGDRERARDKAASSTIGVLESTLRRYEGYIQCLSQRFSLKLVQCF